MKWLFLTLILISAHMVECALKVASPRESLSPRLQALRDSGEGIAHRSLERAKSLRKLSEYQTAIAVLNKEVPEPKITRRNSVSEVSKLRISNTEEN